MKRNLKLSLISGALLCAVGVAGTAPTLYFNTTHHGTATAQAFPTPKTTPTPVAAPSTPVTSGHPATISFPSVNINDVPVVDGYFDTKTQDWTLGLHTAQWGVMTPQPNDFGGNTYIYGHYRPEVFAYLHVIKPGAQAFVTTDNGLRFVYTFDRSIDVSPTDVSLFNYQGPPILTVQTCSGSWFQNRQLFTFKFDHVEKL